MDYTEALMNLIMVLGFVLVFSRRLPIFMRIRQRNIRSFIVGSVLFWQSGELHHMFLNNLNRA